MSQHPSEDRVLIVLDLESTPPIVLGTYEATGEATISYRTVDDEYRHAPEDCVAVVSVDRPGFTPRRRESSAFTAGAIHGLEGYCRETQLRGIWGSVHITGYLKASLALGEFGRGVLRGLALGARMQSEQQTATIDAWHERFAARQARRRGRRQGEVSG